MFKYLLIYIAILFFLVGLYMAYYQGIKESYWLFMFTIFFFFWYLYKKLESKKS